jgi:HSP20 family protein
MYMSSKMLNLVNQLFDYDTSLLNSWLAQSYNNNSTSVSLNIYENDTSYTVELPALKLKKEYFKINFENNILTLSYEEKAESEKDINEFGQPIYYQFKKQSSFSRSIRFEKNIDKDSIKSELRDGILKIYLPKTEKSGGKIIEIE